MKKDVKNHAPGGGTSSVETSNVPADVGAEKNAVAILSQDKSLANAGEAAAWGDMPNLTSKDVMLPRVLLMQGMSDLVMEGKATFGELRESLNGELLGKFEQGFDCVPFHMEKVWIEFKVENENGKEKRTFLRSIPITPDNEALPFQDEETLLADGKAGKAGEVIPIGRDRTMNFFVLLTKELELGSALPYVISLSKSSLSCGKKLTTQMYMKNLNAGKTPASMTVHLFAKKDSNDKGTYGVWDMRPVKQTDAKDIAEAFKWLTRIRAGQTKTHEVLDREVGEAGTTGKF